MPWGNKPLPEPMLTEIYVAIWTTLDHSELINPPIRISHTLWQPHMSVITYKITTKSTICSTTCSAHSYNTENIKAPHYWPFVRKTVCHWWIPITIVTERGNIISNAENVSRSWRLHDTHILCPSLTHQYHIHRKIHHRQCSVIVY